MVDTCVAWAKQKVMRVDALSAIHVQVAGDASIANAVEQNGSTFTHLFTCKRRSRCIRMHWRQKEPRRQLMSGQHSELFVSP